MVTFKTLCLERADSRSAPTTVGKIFIEYLCFIRGSTSLEGKTTSYLKVLDCNLIWFLFLSVDYFFGLFFGFFSGFVDSRTEVTDFCLHQLQILFLPFFVSCSNFPFTCLNVVLTIFQKILSFEDFVFADC